MSELRDEGLSLVETPWMIPARDAEMKKPVLKGATAQGTTKKCVIQRVTTGLERV